MGSVSQGRSFEVIRSPLISEKVDFCLSVQSLCI